MGLDIYIKRVSKNNQKKDALDAWDYESELRRRSLKRFMDKVNKEDSNEHLDALKRRFSGFIWGNWRNDLKQCENILQLQALMHRIFPPDESDQWFVNYPWSTNDNFYFRKVNPVYAYCKDNGLIDEHEMAIVTQEQMTDLMKKAQKLLAMNPEAAIAKGSDILPTISGCFFGSTDYDEYYLKMVKEIERKTRFMLKHHHGSFVIDFSW